MNEVEIEAWVAQAPQGQQGFREAVHTILDSIGHSQNLSAKMVMKGACYWPSDMTAPGIPVT